MSQLVDEDRPSDGERTATRALPCRKMCTLGSLTFCVATGELNVPLRFVDVESFAGVRPEHVEQRSLRFLELVVKVSPAAGLYVSVGLWSTIWVWW